MNDEHESRHPDRDRLQQLLADRATEGLDPAEWAEIEQLLMSFPDEDPNSWDQAAAWVDVALVEAHERDPEPLPDHLRAGIVAQGRLTVRGRHAAPPRRTSPEPVGAPPAPPRKAHPVPISIGKELGAGVAIGASVAQNRIGSSGDRARTHHHDRSPSLPRRCVRTVHGAGHRS